MADGGLSIILSIAARCAQFGSALTMTTAKKVRISRIMGLCVVLTALALALALALGGGSLYAGHLLTKPARSVASSPPSELSARTISFPSASGSVIRGWFSPGIRGRGAVLLLHPVRSSRTAMIGRAKFLRSLGYAVLLVDLQAHGESPGERITFGYREGMDAVAAVATLKQLAPGESLGAIGVSLGAASLVLSGAHQALDAIVIESMYPGIAEAVQNRLQLHLGEWSCVLSPLLLWQLQPRLGISAQELRPIERVSLIQSRVLLVHGTEDRHTLMGEAERVFEGIKSPKEMYAVQGAAHVDLHQFAGRDYEKRISQFFVVLQRKDG